MTVGRHFRFRVWRKQRGRRKGKRPSGDVPRVAKTGNHVKVFAESFTLLRINISFKLEEEKEKAAKSREANDKKQLQASGRIVAKLKGDMSKMERDHKIPFNIKNSKPNSLNGLIFNRSTSTKACYRPWKRRSGSLQYCRPNVHSATHPRSWWCFYGVFWLGAGDREWNQRD